MTDRQPNGGRGVLYATAPAIFLIVGEGLAWALAVIADVDWVDLLSFGVMTCGVAAAILVPIDISRSPQEDSRSLAVASALAGLLGLFVALILLFGAATAHCEGSCLG